MQAHCLFEQSGTFKNEFIKLGINAFDYDLLNDFDETDFQIDLFKEIDRAFEGGRSIFDTIQDEDLIIAFYPCTLFNHNNVLLFSGENYQHKHASIVNKLEYSMKRHIELHNMYEWLCKLCILALKRNLKLIIENPYTQPHYLTNYFPIQPAIIDKNRRINGDYYKKPTQYFFINTEPKNNFIFEPIDFIEEKRMKIFDRSYFYSHYHNSDFVIMQV